MERFDVDGDRAFAILKRYSQDTNTKLRDVAQYLIDTRKLHQQIEGLLPVTGRPPQRVAKPQRGERDARADASP